MSCQSNRTLRGAAVPNPEVVNRRRLAYLVSIVLDDWTPSRDGTELIRHGGDTRRAATFATVRRILADLGDPPFPVEARAVLRELWRFADDVAATGAAAPPGERIFDEFLAEDALTDGWLLAAGRPGGDELSARMPVGWAS